MADFADGTDFEDLEVGDVVVCLNPGVNMGVERYVGQMRIVSKKFKRYFQVIGVDGGKFYPKDWVFLGNLIDATGLEEIEAMKLLLEHDADVNMIKNHRGPPLCIAADKKNMEALLLLLKHGANPNQRDENRWTPLLYSAKKGWTEGTVALIKHGAETNDQYGRALKVASTYERDELVSYFLTNFPYIQLFGDIRHVRTKYGWVSHRRVNLDDKYLWTSQALRPNSQALRPKFRDLYMNDPKYKFKRYTPRTEHLKDHWKYMCKRFVSAITGKQGLLSTKHPPLIGIDLVVEVLKDVISLVEDTGTDEELETIKKTMMGEICRFIELFKCDQNGTRDDSPEFWAFGASKRTGRRSNNLIQSFLKSNPTGCPRLLKFLDAVRPILSPQTKPCKKPSSSSKKRADSAQQLFLKLRL